MIAIIVNTLDDFSSTEWRKCALLSVDFVELMLLEIALRVLGLRPPRFLLLPRLFFDRLLLGLRAILAEHILKAC